MAARIELELVDLDATTGADFEDLRNFVPLPSGATSLEYGDEFLTSFEIPATTLVGLEDGQLRIDTPDGITHFTGDFLVRRSALVLDHSPEVGYTYVFQYEWITDDTTTIGSIDFNRYPDPGFHIYGIDLPYSQVADLALADFIADGTEIVGTRLGDTLTMTNHSEIVRGEGGDDRISTLGGDDTVFGGEGDDTLDGGAGNDVLDGGAGVDTVLYGGSIGVSLNLAQGRAAVGGETDRLVAIENVTASDANDVILGDAADNVLAGLQGDDRIDGNAGADTLSGGTGADRIDGGPGDDVLAGENGDDWLFGGADDDVLTGGAGADRLYGGDGDDRLSGGPTADRLTGGAGADTFVLLAPFHGPDQLLDFTSGEDKIEINAAGFSVQIVGTTLTATSDPYVWEFQYFDGIGVIRSGALSYDMDSGWLRWDATPDHSDDAVHIATLPSGPLTLNDFVLV